MAIARAGARGVLVVVVGFCLNGRAGAVWAQQSCRGDLDGDGRVTSADVQLLLPLLPLAEDLDAALVARADANADGRVRVADVVAILLADGTSCSPTTPTPSASATPDDPTATPSASPTASPTNTGDILTPTFTPTPTLTRTSTVTPTPTMVCTVQALGLGDTDGTLAATDCLRNAGDEVRHVDVYSVSGLPGQALSLSLSAASGQALQPYMMLRDADGQFGSVDGRGPIEFVVSTVQPYELLVTSEPRSTEMFGDYTLSMRARACPTPEALSFPRTRTTTLSTTDCPDPGVPTRSSAPDPAHLYIISVPDVPSNISVRMRQSSGSDALSPQLAIVAPNGIEIVRTDQNVDCTAASSEAECVIVRFLALQAGTYTIVAKGGTGRYSVSVASPTCRRTAISNLGETTQTINGRLYGDTSRSGWCAAPAPVPGSEAVDVPEPGSPADLYTFSGNAGDVISAEVESSGDLHLFLIGPTTLGAPLIVQADESVVFGTEVQIAATLPISGTYTLVVAENNILEPPDPEDRGDIGDVVDYSLFVRKCPSRGPLTPGGTVVSSRFDSFDCFGFGGIPFRTYFMNGTAAQFVRVSMEADEVDAFVRLFAPDGSLLAANDNDPFQPLGPHAGSANLLPLAGTYIVEVSTALDGGAVEVVGGTAPAFTLRALTCATAAASPGSVNGSFDEADCELPGGRKLDVYTFGATAALVPGVGTVEPPVNGCVLGLRAGGGQVPSDDCSTVPVAIPLLRSGLHGFVVAANSPSTRGSYGAGLRRCPASPLGLGAAATGVLADGDCEAPGLGLVDWFVIRDSASIVRFNDGVLGRLDTGATLRGIAGDRFGAFSFAANFAHDPAAMFAIGTDLAALLGVTGSGTADRGAYTVRVDPVILRSGL